MSTPNVRDFYKGKGILITGGTGFIGKVIVEKFLWSIPDIEKLYILVRKKKGKTPQERLKVDILDSPIMNRLKERHGKGFQEWAFSKIEGVVGDVSADQEFIAPDVQKRIADKVHVIIHSAATIGFFEKLNDAFNLNTLGSLRMVEFAKKCPNFESFVHISTCYVNAPMKGKTIEEKIYPLKIPDWDGTHEEFIQYVLKKTPDEIKKLTEKILEGTQHPNTYTFTKSCTEQILLTKREGLPIAICRPSIVGGALKEPYPGWVDAVGAAGGIYVSAGLGISHIVPGDPKAITDQVPVDLVVNGCIIAGAYMAKKNDMQVFHLGTSSRNPVTWGVAEDGVLRYWHGHIPKSAISEADLQIIKSDFIYKMKFFLMYSAVARAYDVFARILPTNKNKENAKMLNKVEQRVVFLNDNFKFFMSHEWIFDTRQVEVIESSLTKEENAIFNVNPREIDWSSYFQYFCYGLHKWIIKEDPNPPSILKSDLVKQSTARMFSDVQFAMDVSGAFGGDEVLKNKTRDQVKEMILSSKRVQDAIQKEAETKSRKFVEVEDSANQIMNTMLANPKAPAVKLFAWYLRKIWRTLYTSIIVDDFDIERIKSLHTDRSNGPMIIIPTHRSYVDFLITSYIFLAYKIPLPHIAAGEDFLNMSLVQTLFRYSGAFFIRRTFNEDLLYKSIFVEYVQQLLMDHASIEFFTEGTRSREGKTLQPKLGLLSVIVEAFFEKKINNLTILPLNISYERFLEGSGYSRELLGEKKKQESLRNLINAAGILKTNYGDINVKFAEPISLAKFVADLLKEFGNTFDPYSNEKDKRTVIKRLALAISNELNATSVIMPTTMVATIMMAYRGGLSVEEMVSKMNWIKKEVSARGGIVHVPLVNTSSLPQVVDRALDHLKDVLVVQKGMIEIRDDKLHQLHLSIYRNQLLYLFVNEAIVTCSLETMRKSEDGVNKESLVVECNYLADLLSMEFIQPEKKAVDFSLVIDDMKKKVVLNNKNLVENHKLAYLMNTLIWPFVEAYWIASMTLFTFQEKDESIHSTEEKLMMRAQWLAAKFYKEGKSVFYESCSKIQLNNAFQTFVRWGILVKDKKKISLSNDYMQMDKLLGFVGRIGRFRKMEKFKKGSSPYFPLLSKM